MKLTPGVGSMTVPACREMRLMNQKVLIQPTSMMNSRIEARPRPGLVTNGFRMPSTLLKAQSSALTVISTGDITRTPRRKYCPLLRQWNLDVRRRGR